MSDLKYLFEAEFVDGEILLQPEDNKSRVHKMDAEGYQPSAFRDVLDKEKKVRLREFHLVGEGHRYTVNLEDGHFEIDGIPFVAHQQGLRVWSTKDDPLRIIFFRETKQEQNLTFRMDGEGGSELESVENGERYVSRYFIGWQTKLANGENIQQTIAVE